MPHATKRLSSRAIFERTLRRFVSEGCNLQIGNEVLAGERVIPGQGSGTSPEGLFAAVWFLGSNAHYPYNYFEQQQNDDARLRSIQMVDASYMIQFYRSCEECDALEAAQAFGDWVDSHSGITWAATAITDGRITGVNVYDYHIEYNEDPTQNKTTKSDALYKYAPYGTTIPDCAQDPNCFEMDVDPASDDDAALRRGFSKAKVRFFVSTNGKIESGNIVEYGSGYSKLPRVKIILPNEADVQAGTFIPTLISGNNPPSASFRGAGFSIQRPIVIRDITEAVSVPNGEWEPRAVVNLEIQYERHYGDPWSRNVDPAGNVNVNDRVSHEFKRS